MNVHSIKKHGSILIGSVISTVALLSALPASAESLKEIYQQALENDHEYRAAKADLGSGLESKNLGRAELLPQINGTATWNKSSMDNKLFVGSSNTTTNPNEPNTADIDTTSTGYGVTLQQSLINVSSWHNFKKFKLTSDGAQLKFEIAEQTLILRAAEAYLTTLKSADEVSTAKAEQNALSHQLEQTKQRFEVGLTAITEVHEAQAAYDSSTASRLLADGGLGIAFESLEALTGKSYKTLYPLKMNFSATPPEPLAREEWVKMALENNTSLQIAKINSEISESDAKAKKSAHLPTLVGSISYGDSNVDINDATIQDQAGTTIGLQLNVPLYTGGATSASRRQAAKESLKNKELYLKAKRDAVLAARTTHLTVLTSAATVKARAQAITSNRSALEATQAGYDVGTRDLVDVLNSQRFLYRAERDYHDALYDYILATLRLKQAAGILTADDLYNLDKSLDTQRLVAYKPES